MEINFPRTKRRRKSKHQEWLGWCRNGAGCAWSQRCEGHWGLNQILTVSKHPRIETSPHRQVLRMHSFGNTPRTCLVESVIWPPRRTRRYTVVKKIDNLSTLSSWRVCNIRPCIIYGSLLFALEEKAWGPVPPKRPPAPHVVCLLAVSPRNDQQIKKASENGSLLRRTRETAAGEVLCHSRCVSHPTGL